MDLFSSVHFILKTSGLLGSLVGDRKHLTESEDHFLFICFLCHIILDRIVCQTHFWALVTLAMLFRSESVIHHFLFNVPEEINAILSGELETVPNGCIELCSKWHRVISEHSRYIPDFLCKSIALVSDRWRISE